MRTTILTAGFTLTALFCGVTANAADTRLLNLVMPDATTLAGANVTNAEITPFGQYVLNQLTSAADQDLQKFITVTGFDPRHDVIEILAASSSNVSNPSGLILATGNFQVPQITAAIAADAHGLSIQNYNGATLVTGTDAKSNFALAFLGTSIAVVGDTASVKAAVDRSSGANSINPALAVQVQSLSTTQDAWAVTTSPVSTLLAGVMPGQTATPMNPASSPFAGIGQMFSSIQSSSGGIKFGTNVVITGQAVTNDAKAAKSLADVAQALVSIMSLAGGQDTQVAAFAQLLQGLKVTADGMNINLALSIPETQLEAALNGMKNQAKPAIRQGVKPALAPVRKAEIRRIASN